MHGILALSIVFVFYFAVCAAWILSEFLIPIPENDGFSLFLNFWLIRLYLKFEILLTLFFLFQSGQTGSRDLQVHNTTRQRWSFASPQIESIAVP